MQASWIDGFDQRVLVGRFVQLAKSGGLVGFDGESKNFVTLLRSMVKFSEELPWGVRYELLEDAVRNAANAGAATPKELLTHIQSAAKAYGARPLVKFVMYTSITINRDNKLRSIRTRGVKLSFLRQMPKAVHAARAVLFQEHRSWLPLDRDPVMLVIKAEVEARTPEEAASRSLDAIDVLRGIWNFFLTTSWRHTFGGPRKPIGKIFVGPIHTFHEPTGGVSQGQFWYETTLWPSAVITDLTSDKNGMLDKGHDLRRRVTRHPYSADLEKALVRYARALDLEDHDLAIQKLWSLLEFLTDTGLDNYDKTIRRTKFLYEDPLYQGQVLEHLRRYRNRSVHGGMSSGDVEGEVYQLKRCVEGVFKFHVGNRFRFKSLAEACSLLDLPPDDVQLRHKLKGIKNAIAFRGSSKP